MFDSDLCYGFLLGFLTAGVLGFITQRLLMLRARSGQAAKKLALVETKQSPRQVFMGSLRAKIEITLWFILFIVVIVAVLWVYLS